MAASEAQRVALMAIQPRYAQAILAGNKRIEFRKRSLAPDVRTVLIYETAPTQRIVGEFDIEQHVVTTPTRMWSRFGSVGAIDARSFAVYFAGHDKAVGLEIASARRYGHPVALGEVTPVPAIPQSFAYLGSTTLSQIRCLAHAGSAEIGRLLPV